MAKSTNGGIDAASAKLVEKLMKELTLAEKCDLLSGRDGWSTVPLPAKGLGSVIVTDGPHGVRTEGEKDGRKVGPATYFPTGVSMASTWNPELMFRLGEALAEETLAYECDILLGPCVNIVRSPLAGRNFESMAEDPFLAGRLAAAWINGIQSRGVGASLKHYACNNQETERMRGSSQVDERTLREIYLPQFEYAVKESQPWTVMCAYNRINGIHASQHHHLLTTILREEWGFKGLVISDWGANHTVTESVAAGLDLEMPGPALFYKQLLNSATHWQIDEAHIDRAARKVLELAARAGKLGKSKTVSKGFVNTKAHQMLALEIAEESITLLKNEGQVLPLNPKRVKTVALLGINAGIATQGGGSSSVNSPYRVSPYEAVKKLLGPDVEVKYIPGCSNNEKVPIANMDLFRTPDGKTVGIQVEYFNNTTLAGQPVGTCINRCADAWWRSPDDPAPVKGLSYESHSGRYTAKLQVDADGKYQLDVDVQGMAQVFIDGKLLFKTHPFDEKADWGTGKATLAMQKGRAYDFKLEYVKSPAKPWVHVRIGFGLISTEEGIVQAAELAKACDVAIVFAGYCDNYESEGFDRSDLKLPGPQDKLITAVLNAKPDAIVVLNTGAPVEMPWAQQAKAIIQAYYAGMEGGTAIANILFGKTNPSGKLGVSYPQRIEDTPAFINFPGGREVNYGEGVFVGYRYYDKKKIAPLFPFGHGMSYTAFKYSMLKVPAKAKAGRDVVVKLTVTNTGSIRGQEVVQLYVGDKVASVARPEKELKGFVKVDLKPGQSREVQFKLDARAFAFYDVLKKDWVVEPGEFEILAASSSQDIRAKAMLVLEK